MSTDKDEQLHFLSAQVGYYSEFIQKCPHWTFVNGYVDEGIKRCKVTIEDVMRRKEKLLDLSIDVSISDEEFSLRNNRFNEEIDSQNRWLKELEEEKLNSRDMMQSVEMLRRAVTYEKKAPRYYWYSVMLCNHWSKRKNMFGIIKNTDLQN